MVKVNVRLGANARDRGRRSGWYFSEECVRARHGGGGKCSIVLGLRLYSDSVDEGQALKGKGFEFHITTTTTNTSM